MLAPRVHMYSFGMFESSAPYADMLVRGTLEIQVTDRNCTSFDLKQERTYDTNR